MKYIVSHKMAFRVLAIICLLCLSSLTLASFIGPVTTSPSTPISIKDNQVNTVTINWVGSSLPATAFPSGTSYQISSTLGTLSDIQGSFPSAINRTVSTTLVAAPNSTLAFTIRERLLIPKSALFRARQNGSTQLQYTRIFVDGTDNSPITAVATLRITNSTSGLLAISQIDLRFSTNNLTEVVRNDEVLFAYANVSHAGSGIFDAVWEIATPASTSGNPVFTTIATVRKLLAAGRNVLVESPPLPTDITGNYLVRLRTRLPETNFDILQIRYSVLPTNKPVIAVKKLFLLNPTNNSVVTGNTIFNWEPITGTKAYQLEIIEADSVELPSLNTLNPSLSDSKEDEPLSAGVLLPSGQQSSVLTKLVLEHLKPGRAYQWRTIAINNDGNIIGKSEYRSIRLKK
jgi:hypothetical protein